MDENSIPEVALRLREFIIHSGLSSSQIADKIGIPRPTFSQLINGRSRSINDLILRKFDENFPELNLTWLLFGRGDMLNSTNIEISEPQNCEELPSPNIQESNNKPITDENKETALCNAPLLNQENIATRQTNPETKVVIEHKEIQRRIKSILVLYTDGSFETLNPS